MKVWLQGAGCGLLAISYPAYHICLPALGVVLRHLKRLSLRAAQCMAMMYLAAFRLWMHADQALMLTVLATLPPRSALVVSLKQSQAMNANPQGNLQFLPTLPLAIPSDERRAMSTEFEDSRPDESAILLNFEQRSARLVSRESPSALRCILAAASVQLLLSIGSFIALAPQTELLQNIICKDYYQDHDLGLTSGLDRCKAEPIQAEVAYINAWREAFETVPCNSSPGRERSELQC